jgi:hypothetical protein
LANILDDIAISLYQSPLGQMVTGEAKMPTKEGLIAALRSIPKLDAKAREDESGALMDALSNLVNPLGGAMAGILAGPKAATADMAKLLRAKTMEGSKKVSTDQIKNETGWFRGPNREWKFEIPDNEMRLVEENWWDPIGLSGHPSIQPRERTYVNNDSDSSVLSRVLKHDKLFDAYPQMKGWHYEGMFGPDELHKGTHYPQGSRWGGEEDMSTPLITATGTDRQDLLDVLAHELQHGVQHIENFPTGGTISGFKQLENLSHADATNRYRNLMGEAEARAVAKRRNKPQEYLDLIHPHDDYDVNLRELTVK